jgi:hypothetical protein
MRFTTIRRAIAALAAAGAVTMSASGTAHVALPDLVKLTDNEVDFGGSNWDGLLSDPVGTGSVQWSVVNGYYTPRSVGTLHLNNARNQWGRMHIDYYDGAGTYLYTELTHGPRGLRQQSSSVVGALVALHPAADRAGPRVHGDQR